MSTQLQYAIKGYITPEMEQAASFDHVSPEWLCAQIASGKCVIPKNKHRNFKARAIGNGLTTKINANVGTSAKRCFVKHELTKLKIATQYGADAVMDLSTGGDLHSILKNILSESPVMVGTVPIYTVVARKETSSSTIFDADELINEIETQAKMGVDFMTLHAAITRRSLSIIEAKSRITGIVSRGGSLMYAYMKTSGNENPLYEHFDKILEICQKYDVTISLGDALRPGSGHDANDACQIEELLVQGELVRRAWEKGVQVMVEGPGHMPLNQIEMSIRLMKKLCHGAPIYVLGPLTTDAAAGYDHIAGAIGGAIAATYGADFLCYVTPAEHLCLPTEEDVKLGVIATRIAAHSADVAKGIPSALTRDQNLSKARFNLQWDQMFQYMLEPELAQKRRSESESASEEVCTMCGDLCAMKTFQKTTPN